MRSISKKLLRQNRKTKEELGCLGRFVKFSVVRVTMYMNQVLHPDMCIYIYIADSMCTPDRRQSKTPPPPTNTDQRPPGKDLPIVICRPTGAKWPPKKPLKRSPTRARRPSRSLPTAAHLV